MTFKRIAQTTILVSTALAITACSSLSKLDRVVKDNREKYQKATVLPPLDVPPDLSTARINDEFAQANNDEPYIEFDSTAESPLAAKYNVAPSTKPALMGEGDSRYLVVYGDNAILWQRMLNFWSEQGLAIHRQDQQLGLMDTDNDDDGYGYRMYVDQGNRDNSLEVKISATGFDNNAQKNEAKLRQLAEYMGKLHLAEHQTVNPTTTTAINSAPAATSHVAPAPITAVDAVIIDEASEQQALMVDLPKDDVWQRVGRILESKYFVVQDRERDKGIYFVQYLDPFLLAKTQERSLMSKMAFWQDEQDYAPELFYYIKMVTDEGKTKVIIKDIDQIRTSSPSARRLLRLLQEKLAY